MQRALNLQSINGVAPNVNNSHNTTPSDHMSDFKVKLPEVIDSGAHHGKSRSTGTKGTNLYDKEERKQLELLHNHVMTKIKISLRTIVRLGNIKSFNF